MNSAMGGRARVTKRASKRDKHGPRGYTNYQREQGKTKIIPANQGRIRKLEELLAAKTSYYESRRKIDFDPREICIGVVRVS